MMYLDWNCYRLTLFPQLFFSVCCHAPCLVFAKKNVHFFFVFHEKAFVHVSFKKKIPPLNHLILHVFLGGLGYKEMRFMQQPEIIKHLKTSVSVIAVDISDIFCHFDGILIF